MENQKIITVKYKDKLASQPVVQAKSKSELEGQTPEQPEPIVRPQKEIELIEQTTTAKTEPANHLKSLATTQRIDSIFGSGWEYSQLVKEFRD